MQVTDTRFGFQETLRIGFGLYRNGQPSWWLVTDDDETWLVATSDSASPVPTGGIAFKDRSENEGVPEILSRARVIEGDPVSRVHTGYIAVPIYLTAAALQSAGAVQS
jgi:hypothetical protein